MNRLIRNGVLASLIVGLTNTLSAAPPEPDWKGVGESLTQQLADYVRIDTQNPPGHTVEAANFLENIARAAGLSVERFTPFPNKPFIAVRLPGSDPNLKPIVLLNHMDVVPADPTQWTYPPFSGVVHDGMLYGRGTIDIKGFGLMQLAALRLIAETKVQPRHTIIFLAVPDEEVGGTEGVAWLAQNRPDLMDVAAVWDEGGGGIIGALPKPLLSISIAEKTALWIKLIAEGPSGHGSRPIPEAATLRLHNALQRILTKPPPSRVTPTMRKAMRKIGTGLGGMQGFAMKHLDNPFIWPIGRRAVERDPYVSAFLRDSISLTMLDAGYKPNVIPERAEAVLDCRLLPGTTQDGFLAELTRTIQDAHVRIEVLQPALATGPSPTRNAFYKVMESAAREVYPDGIVTPFLALGATDSRYFRQRGVPAYGFMPIVVPKDIMSTAHGIDERIPVATLGPGVRVIYRVLQQM